MRIDGKPARTAFILGAGATRGALRHVLLNNRRIKAPLNSDFFRIAETYVRAQGMASADAKRLDRLRTIFKSDLLARWPPPMETAFSLLYTAKDFPEIYASRRGPKPEPGESREMEDFLSLLFDILDSLDRGSKKTGYDRLAGALEDGDMVITLNYDTLMDSALVRRGWDPRTGYAIAGGANKIKWGPGRTTTPVASGIKLLKLHGSLNWWVRGSLATLSNVFSKKPVAVTRPRANDQSGKIRQIIPPIYGKAFGHPHWRSLWESAFSGLCNAEALVVVGCSIVDTDYHLQAFLRRVVKERRNRENKFKHAVLVDRVRIRRRWNKVLKGAVTRYSTHNTFEAFLSEGVSA